MKLNDDQIATVKEWAAGGETLTGIQKRLKTECGITLTYLETRLLVGDLGIQLDEWKPKPKPTPEEVVAPTETPVEPDPTPAGFSLTMDKITRPGALVSGRAHFSDGKQAGWWLDQQGRLGLDAGSPGYRPPAADIPIFQAALDRELRKIGL